MPTKSDRPKARLEDLDVREVSIVDRPANKRKFLIVKRDDFLEDTMARRAAPADEARTEKNDVTPEASFNGVLGLVENDDQPELVEKDDDKDDKAKAAPSAGSLLGPSTSILGTLTKAAEASKKAAGKLSAPVLSQVKACHDGLLKMCGESEKAKAKDDDEKAKAKDDDEKAKAKDDDEKAKAKDDDEKAKAKDDEEKADAPISAALTKLMAIVAKLKSMGAKDDASAMLPELKAVAVLLAPLTKAKAKDDETEKTKKAEGGDLVEGLVDMDDDLGESYEVFKSADGSDDPIIIVKVGAKMKRARLSKFRKALETLKSILEELDVGEAKKVEKSDDADTSSDDRVLAALTALGERVDSRLDKIEGSVQAVDKRVTSVENMRPVGAGDSEPVTPVKKTEDSELGWGSVLGIPER